jgi:diadenosine tetraphosphate (Ap4A) HIT family hydrolase
MSFTVDERLLENSIVICDMELSRLVLKNDRENPWFLLIPRKSKATEIIDLNGEEQMMLMEEVALVSEFLKEFYRPYKINVANLGNVVRQLHVHIIARFEHDRAWPNPIWNTPVGNYFDEAELNNIKSNFLEFID